MRMLRGLYLMIRNEGFSGDWCKEAVMHDARQIGNEVREIVLAFVNDPHFACLAPSSIATILAKECGYVGSESTIVCIRRQQSRLNHRGRSPPPGDP